MTASVSVQPLRSSVSRLSGVRGRRLARGATGVAVSIVLWELAVRLGLISQDSLPLATTVLSETARLLTDRAFLGDVAFTVRSYAIGLAAATVVGVTLGAVLGASPRLARWSDAVVELLRPIPSVALIPLGILLFGRGTNLSVALVIWACTWPLLFNTSYGVRAVDPVAIETARSFRLGRLTTMRRVTLPSAVPYIATGVRIASAVAIIITVSAELIAGGRAGLGTWILRVSATGTNLHLVYAGTLVAGLLGLATNSIFVGLERHIAGWHVLRTEEDGR